ncbi:homeobox-leucine zipper protein HAT2 [Brassica napus]|uniref:homeobox-leucine zipper protein HAT2 n=1 Tax=Brassica napus TaxID=3708 RepID=UPI002078AB05|nr:homeobox-leucine zipper protein HAT2 [Brassica napus]
MILQLSVLPAFPLILWRLPCYSDEPTNPFHFNFLLLHLELKPLPRIYAHSFCPGFGYWAGSEFGPICSQDISGGGETSRKKLRLSKDQSAFLEDTFKEHNTLNPKQKVALAKKLNMTARQVEVWFQNRRARTKLKQTEVDCEYLKRCVEKLTEENRRLQKEAMELRTLKLSPQFYGQMTPPTTLIMCPSCERVAGPSSNHHQTHRPVAINPWVARAGQVAHGLDFEALRPRS